ncbi:MAG TPA: tRNA 5-methoxyuridine(34)/uridine 5-oxyacetic acid(34) synthase CmoB [Planctomycetaceae bacterium]|nr:tRNA 5-methoxyuridine(34)/uridine 5-oxyacetic acid(34) synthase CmoB [Planctomycetaceae bacterium]
MNWLDSRSTLWERLTDLRLEPWAEQLRQSEAAWFAPGTHGTLPKWLAAGENLPNIDAAIQVKGGVVEVVPTARACDSSSSPVTDVRRLSRELMEFHPWRKGPFRVFGVDIDTEWRSDWKWSRLTDAIDLVGKNVLDVGCGNGYYGWRMVNEGARFVLGVEPFKLYATQFEIFRRYDPEQRHFVIPGGDTDLPSGMQAFDTVFSMGVLYHRPNPIDHLQRMRDALRSGGELVLETIVLDREGSQVLTPEGRYAKMRNVWFIPTIELLGIWLRRSGFRDVEVVDVSPTKIDEQRRTDWMTFESLADFLNPNNPTQTIEGYPAPVRAILTARRK